jgi:hypothetical protein
LTISGNLIADGDFDMATAGNQVCNVTFTGSDNKTISGAGVELFQHKDSEAPAYNDLSLGSNFVVNLNKKNWNLIDLNGIGGLSDDYFVILGTTKNKFNWKANMLHEEANQHSDAMVSISSASLLEHGINFATIHGNHNDGICSQSNIYDPDLLPRIINSYFLNNMEDFYSTLSSEPLIKAIVNSTPNNTIVLKPAGASLENLNLGQFSTGENDVNYQKGNLQIEINLPIPYLNVEEYSTFYNNHKRILELYPYSLVQIPGYRFIGICIRGFSYVGTFYKNKFNPEGPFYYFTGALLSGCSIGLVQGNNVVKIMDKTYNPFMAKSLSFKYCQTNYISFTSNSIMAPLSTLNNQTDSKSSNVLLLGQLPSDTIRAFFHVDDQATYSTPHFLDQRMSFLN